VLSRRDQRLIERLSRSALVTPPLPIAKNAVFGVVEKVCPKSTESARRIVSVRTEGVTPLALQAKRVIPDLPRPRLPGHERLLEEQPSHRNLSDANRPGLISIHEAIAKMYGVRDEGFQQWGALGILIAVCLVVILARVYGVSLLARTAPMRTPPAVSALIGRAAIRVSPPMVPLPSAQKPKHRITPPKPEPEPTFVARKSALLPSGSEESITDSSSAAAPIESAPTALSGVSERPFVSELPQGYFVEPAVSDPNLVGELHLRALIGADGSVKEVTVVSGNPKLAEAGMRAVRRWHYSPYQAPGGSDEGETLIRMRFFGQDAVSITSVAR
jgi:hypothetical protein